MRKNKFITIIGNVGSGKSTIAYFLSQNLPAELIAADELYKTNPFFKDAVVDRTRWSLSSDIWFLLKRVEFSRTFEKKLKQNTIVQDSGIPMSWIYANSRVHASHVNEHESDIYNTLFSELTTNLPQEDLIIYLNLPTEKLLQRIKKRARDYELKFFTEEYLENLQKSLTVYIKTLKKEKRNVLEFNETNWCDVVENKEEQEKFLHLVKNILKR